MFDGEVPLGVEVISDSRCVERDLIEVELYLHEGITCAKRVDIQEISRADNSYVEFTLFEWFL